MTREKTLAAAAPTRRSIADREAARFAAFRSAYGLNEDAEAVSLYLSSLGDGESGSAIRRRLEALDLERRLRGVSPWMADPDVRALLRGIHSERPVGPHAPSTVDPLYLEHMRALVDASRVTSVHQRRAVAAIILHAHTGLPAAALARLTWNQLSITRTSAIVVVPQRVGRGAWTERSWRLAALPGNPACPVSRLLPLRGGHFVLVDKAGPWDEARLRASLEPYVRNSVAKHSVQSALVEASGGTPSAIRDRALLTMGYGAGLRTYEASKLLQRDVIVREGGLTLRVDGRRSEVCIPTISDLRYDAVRAWQEWVACMRARGRAGPRQPAFPTCNHSLVDDKALSAQGLNRIVHLRCEQANLRGYFAWTSLRTGMMRTAIRSGAHEWAVAYQADLTSLASVQRHERRETLLVRNVAGQLGL